MQRWQYPLDEAAFDCITSDSAYWLGLLMTDGNVHTPANRQPRITLVLGERDKEHIEKFKTFLQSGHTIFFKQPKASKFASSDKVYWSKGQYGIAFSSTRIAAALSRHGIVPRKSASARASDILATNRHFWRGCVDGDGSIGSSGKHPWLTLYGSQHLCEQFRDFILNTLSIEGTVVRKNNTLYTTRYRCAKALQAIRYLYADDLIALNRKMKVANSIVALGG